MIGLNIKMPKKCKDCPCWLDYCIPLDRYTGESKPSDCPLVNDVQEVKHGHWEEVRDMWGDTLWRCDCCGIEWDFIEGDPMDNGTNYCPNCGAKMEEI